MHTRTRTHTYAFQINSGIEGRKESKKENKKGKEGSNNGTKRQNSVPGSSLKGWRSES